LLIVDPLRSLRRVCCAGTQGCKRSRQQSWYRPVGFERQALIGPPAAPARLLASMHALTPSVSHMPLTPSVSHTCPPLIPQHPGTHPMPRKASPGAAARQAGRAQPGSGQPGGRTRRSVAFCSALSAFGHTTSKRTRRSPLLPGACAPAGREAAGREHFGSGARAAAPHLADRHALAGHDPLRRRAGRARRRHAQLAAVQRGQRAPAVAQRVDQRHAQRAHQVVLLAPEHGVRLLLDHKHDVRRRGPRPLVACRAGTPRQSRAGPAGSPDMQARRAASRGDASMQRLAKLRRKRCLQDARPGAMGWASGRAARLSRRT